MSIRKPYNQRSDIDRIESQWRKLTGLHSREEWSAAIVRAATAAEIAANLAIRKEFAARSQFDAKFIDSLLRWANGLAGKIDHLLLPLNAGNQNRAKIQKLTSVASRINNVRNDIVHRGIFCNEAEARDVIGQAKIFIETLVQIHEPGFKLSR